MKSISRWAALFVLVGGAVQAASPALADLTTSPSSFVIDVPVGGPDPTPSTLTVTNSGTGGNLIWTATIAYIPPAPPSPWLTLSSMGSTLHKGDSIGVAVQVAVGTLPGGNYNAKITISGAGKSFDSTVLLRVNAVPVFGVNPTSFTFAAPQNGANPPSQTLNVQNTGGGTLDWNFSVNQSWVQISPVPQDLGPAASQNLQVQVFTGSLSAMLHTATITLSAPGLTNVLINVNFTINANPAIGLQPTSLTFDAPEGGPSPAAQQFTVKNDGGLTLFWHAADSETWMDVNPKNGSLLSGQSQVLTVTVDVVTAPAPLEGTYAGTISVTGDPPTANSPRTLGVTLTINSTPKIGVSQETLSFTRAFDLGPAPPAAVSITNTGSGTLNWSVTGGATWVTASPNGGALGVLTSEPLLISAIPTGKTPGVYTTTLQITAPGASNSPRTIAVEMTVTASSLPITAPAGQCGLMGLELLAVLLLLRSLKSRGGPSCTSR